MTEGKNEHYVPRFILRGFALACSKQKKLIGVYHLPTLRFGLDGRIDCEASLDHFYRDPVTREAIQNLESKAASLLSKILREETLPTPTTDPHILLTSFVLVQHGRTLRASLQSEMAHMLSLTAIRTASGQVNSAFLDAYDASVRRDQQRAISVELAIKGVPMACDLRYRLLRNQTNTPFILSDNPAVFYNQFGEQTLPEVNWSGLAARGLQIMLPLTKKYVLIFYDPTIYRVGRERHNVACVDVTDEKDVDELNTLQVVNAHEKLFFGDGATAAYLQRLITKATPYLFTELAAAKTLPAVVDGERNGEIVGTSHTEVRTNLVVSSIEMLVSANRFSSQQNNHRFRNHALLQQMTGRPRNLPKPFRGRVLRTYGKNQTPPKLDNPPQQAHT